MYFPKEEYEQRWSRLHDEMARRGFETAVIWQRTGGGYDRAGDVWYLSNYAAQNNGQEPSTTGVGQAFAALLVRRGEEPELHILRADYSLIESIERDHVAVDRIVADADNLATGVAKRLNELGIEGQVAYVGDDFLPIEMYRALVADTPSIDWVPQDDLLYPLQRRKSARELDLFREAGEVAARALNAFMDGLIRGDRQCDAASRAAAIIVGAGGGFQRLGCHTGPRGDLSAWDYPLYGYSREAAKPGEIVRAWVIGPILEGYWLAPGSTSVAGLRPTPEQRRLIEDTVGTIEDFMAVTRAGKTPREIGRLCDAAVTKRGYSVDQNGALYGHGYSTFWTGPVIPAGEYDPGRDPFWNIDEPLLNGDLMTAENFLYEPGVGNVGFEEPLIVWDDRVERLTDATKVYW